MNDKDVVAIDSADAAVLAELSDEVIELNVSSVNDLCSTWVSRLNSLNLTSERVDSSFKIFTSYGILVDYIKKLSVAVNSLNVNINQISTKIFESKEEHVSVSKSFVNNYVPSSNYVKNDVSNSNIPSGTQVNNSTDNNLINEGASSSNVSNVGELKDYLGISAVLLNIAITNNKSLGDLLSDLDQATVIKKKLLDSAGINKDTKKVIESMSPEILLTSLKDLNNNGLLNDNMSNTSVKYLYNYLERVSNTNGISIEDLLKNSSYSNLLYESLVGYNGVVNVFDNMSNDSVISVRNELLKIYDGDGISDFDKNTVESVRNVLDVIANEKGTTYEYLVNNGAEIKDAISTVSESKSFVGNLVNSNSSVVQNVIDSLFSNKA